MRKLVVITLFTILVLMGISALGAGVNPNSPGYDEWKKNQDYVPVQAVKPTQPSQPFIHGEDANKDICELLIPWDASFTLAMAPNDDGYTAQMDLPFTFSLYGANYNYCWINNNGNVSFDGPYFNYSSSGFPYAGYPMCAPFWADVDTRGTGSVWYKIETNYMVVIWDHVGYYNSQIDKVNTFELIISDGTFNTIGLGNNVAFSYADMAWTTGSASLGVDGFLGIPATVGINKGDGTSYAQIGRFDHAGIDWDGPYDLNDGVDWLDCQNFLFNTGGFASNVAPIFVSVPPNPVSLVVPNVWNYTVSVASPEAGQITNAVVNHSMPVGMSYLVTPGNTCTIQFTVTTSAANIGTWPIEIVATDDGTPNLQATTEFDIMISPTGFTFEVNAYDLDWYATTMGYVFPSFVPAYNDPNDLVSQILLNGIPFDNPIYTPYTFGGDNDPQPNYPFVAGTYSVVEPGYVDWLPTDITFMSITTNYAADFLGITDDQTPVELSSFTATLDAQNYVQLTWTSQTETNMLGYRVYRNETSEQASATMITPVLIPATNTSAQQTYTLNDSEVEIGHIYYYWLECVDINSSAFHGPMSIVVNGEVPPVLPELSSMRNAYPNPFQANTSTTIEVDVKAGETGTVTIYNLSGQTVRSFNITQGTHNINWNGLDSNGDICSSGVYFYKLSTPSFSQAKKLVIIK